MNISVNILKRKSFGKLRLIYLDIVIHGVRAFSGMQESEFIRNRIVRRDDGEGDFDFIRSACFYTRDGR